MAETEARQILVRVLSAKDRRDLREEEKRRHEEEVGLWRSQVYRQAIDAVNRWGHQMETDTVEVGSGEVFLRRPPMEKGEIELVYRGNDSEEEIVLYSITEHIITGVDDAEPFDERIRLEELSRLVGFMQTSYEPHPAQRT